MFVRSDTPSLFLRLISFCALSLLVACGGGSDSGGGTGGASLQSITVTSQGSSVAAGLMQQFTATGTFSDGSTKTLASVVWTSSDISLATIDRATGLLTSLKQGQVTVSASSGSIVGSETFKIGPPLPIGLVVSPADSLVVIGTPAALS